MKLCITAKGPALNDPVDPSFGRAAYFIFFDTETGSLEAVANEPGAHGAGVQAAQIVSGKGAKAVITGSVGPNAYQGLSAGGIESYIGAKGTVEKAIADYKAGRLTRADGPSGSGHRGGMR